MIIIFEKFSKAIYSPVNQKIKPEIDEHTISIRSYTNDIFYINIYFDNEERVDYIENPWNVDIPDWYGLKINLITVKDFVRKSGGFVSNKPRFYCGYLLEMDAKKYNL